jgi:hypothetical protein
MNDVSTTKIYFTRVLENRSGPLFRQLSPSENQRYELKGQAVDPGKAEKRLRETGSSTPHEDETDLNDEMDKLSMTDVAGIKSWQWSPNFKALEEYVEEHGGKGGGMTDGWALNRGWATVTALRAAFQVVDGGAGGIHGGEQIVLKS